MYYLNSALVQSWGLAALSYDEDKIIDYARDLFGLKLHCKHDAHWSLFYGCAMDKKTGKLRIFNRGTDGIGFWGKVRSWARNCRILTGGDGIHNGFGDAADKIVESFRSQLLDAEEVEICGQSQGAGLTIVEAYKIAKNFPVRHVHGDAFACPPVFDKKGAAKAQQYIDSGKVSIRRFNGRGDPIDSEVLRNEESIFLDGVDVGEEVTLYSVIRFDATPALMLIQHSNAVTNASLMQMYTEVEHPNIDDITTLGKIGRRIIN